MEMDEKDQTRLRKNNVFLLRNLRTEDIVDYLFQEGILSQDNVDEIDDEKRNKDKIKTFLKILPRKGPTAFKVFLKVLRETENGFIADALEQTDVSDTYNLDSPIEGEKPSFPKSLSGENDVLRSIQRQMSQQSRILWETKYEMEQLKEKMLNDHEESERLRLRLQEMENETIIKGYTEDELNEKIDEAIQSLPEGQSGNALRDSAQQNIDEPEGLLTDTDDLDRDSIRIEARLIAKDLVGYVAKTKTGPPPNKHCQTMRNTVDELLVRYDKVFDKINVKLGIDEQTTYKTFESIAQEVLEGDINWGRVVAVYAYSGSLARFCVQQGMGSLVDKIGEFTGKYAAKVLCDWIKRHGGWDKFDDYFPDKKSSEEIRWNRLLWPAVGIGALVGLLLK